MFQTIRKAFQIEDIRRRIFYTFCMLVVVRLGSELPTPGVDPTYIQNFFANQTGDAFNFFDAFTGGSFTSMSVFALSITPYITSSIIMQLLTIAIPKLEEMQRDGEDGRKKIAAITRYVTVALALIESTAMSIGFGRQGLLVEYTWYNAAIVVLTLTAGSAFLMWIGERITEKGVGNGISIVLLINIISRVPDDFVSLFEQFVKGKTVAKGALAAIIILVIVVMLVVFVIILQDGERRIAVQYSQKVQGRKTYGGQSTHIPLKVNTAGVIPVIFASSLMQFPVVIASFLQKGNGSGIGSQILKGMSSSNWCNPDQPIYSIGLVVYIILTIFFAYFYTSITFNPLEIANNMKKSGGFVPGIRPGKPTVEYLQKILNYVIFIGACGLVIVQVIPFFFNGVFGASVSFGGTSLIIIVGVVLETIKQVESQMLVRNYKGFLNADKSSSGLSSTSFLGY
ncbi:preprotein translocase subunit SecY [Hespellia stercorisuis]|uniref:Protein translocase subunit SecY n=1 Tax=Hespellia stercorisuis DSM 15480 TaxID=1121950 RepID=A0A1M6JJ30_9FIRM|nr:preprotein translocase subunit SecY [Hespellia stercorisuis]SHJ46612.1 protein translocase subunit secY/sec61 alpha [Hespellia stercorisuis DSM 15480]